MNFKNWRYWAKSFPWSKRWFIYLVLIRPVVDNFYYLKEISPMVSPLNWIGLLTPVLCIPAIIQNSYKKNKIHSIFNFWSLLIILNSGLLIIQPLDFISLSQWILKLSMPVYLFAFLRIFIRNKTDLIGLLTTFLYSAGIAATILIYELIFQPIRLEYSRGIERIQGGYADVMNYAIYLSFGFLILSYFYILFKSGSQHIKVKLPFLIMVGVLCLLGFIGISHVVSYFVFAFLIVLFVLFIARRFTTASFLVILFLLTGFYLNGDKFYQERLDPMLKQEIEILQGERDEAQLFHGRMMRWTYAWESFKDSPVLAWLIGYSVSFENPLFNISIGIHNDFLRIFYFTGIIGFLLYILFLFSLWKRSRFVQLSEKFLLFSSIAVLLLYSVSTTPTFYPNFLYVLFSILAYFALPAPKLALND